MGTKKLLSLRVLGKGAMLSTGVTAFLAPQVFKLKQSKEHRESKVSGYSCGELGEGGSTPILEWGGVVKDPAYFQLRNLLGSRLVLQYSSSSLKQGSLSPAPRGCGPFKGGWGRGAGRVVSVSSAHASFSEPAPAGEPPRFCRLVPARVPRGPRGGWEESGARRRLTRVGLPDQSRSDSDYRETDSGVTTPRTTSY